MAEQQQQQQHYDWSAFYDEEGRLYYYNSVTEESAWEPPEEGYHPPPTPPAQQQQQQQQHYDWSAHYDDEGRLYYYNSVTEESAWEPPPEGFNPPEGEEDADESGSAADDNKNNTSKNDAPTGPETNNDDDDDAMQVDPEANEQPSDEEEKNNPEKERDDDIVSPTNDDDDGENAPASPPLQSPSRDPSDSPLHSPAAQDLLDDDDVRDENAVTETTEKPMYDWTAHLDEEGRMYYHNAVTDETTWDAPEEGFNPPTEEDLLEETTVPPSDENIVSPANQDTTSATTEAVTPWIAYTDEEGLEYYYNEETGTTQWEKPEKYRQPPPEEESSTKPAEGEGESESDDQASVTKSPTATMDDRGDYGSEGPDESKTVAQQLDEEEQQPQKTPDIDPAVKRLQDAEAALNHTDSVLEPSCLDHIQIIAEATGNPARAMSSVVENYYGQTAVCGLLARWMTQLTTTRQSDPTTSHPKSKDSTSTAVVAATTNALGQTPAEVQADRIRDTVQNVISKMAKERFTKDKGDSILDLSKSEAAFLEDMMDSPRWRKLLIDLSAQHKDSAVLLYCLRAISKRGHHREIALRINPSDHFAVFNAMLLSELAVLGSAAVSAGVNVPAAASLTERMQTELRRACSTTGYTYVYVMQLLRYLDELARQDMAENATDKRQDVDDIDSDSQIRFRRAIRKWSALRELLESGMMDPNATMSNAGSSHLFRKRQLDVSLTVSDLYQNQKRRRRGVAVVDEQCSHDDLERALATLLRRHAIGMQLDDTVLDNLLPSGLDLDTRGVGYLLVRHPLAIRALLGHLFQSGPSRITATSKKNKCARLVALAVLAAQDLAKAEATKCATTNGNSDNGNGDSGDDPPDDVTLTRMILQGSQLCENLETMISFLVTTDQPGTSPGEKLCSLALKCPPVGLGVVIWARAFTAGAEYAASASFPTLSSGILSLVRLVAMRYPFAREYALHVALAFLRHSNSDVSYVKVNLIKEHSLRLLLVLLVKGDIVPVLSSITARLRSNNSELDASLIRYFVAGVLEVVRPPVSPVFVRLFGGLLREPRAVDAVKSTYFAASNRKRLEILLSSFKNVRLYDGAPLGKEEQLLVVSLLSAYQVV